MRAIVARHENELAELSDLDDQLLVGDVALDLDYSSLNFKDGAALTGQGGIVRARPLVLGIDAVGTVTDPGSSALNIGDRVVVNGAGLGETLHGGYAERARVSADSVVQIPDGLTPLRAAAIGTAGFTAALAVIALEERGVRPGDGQVIVTGAAGGAGSIAVSLLAGRGYEVVASSGRAEEQGEYLRKLGAARVIDRAPLEQPLTAPLQAEQWSAVVDGVGSHTLANLLAQTRYGGTAVAYGMAQGIDLPSTVLPFILRAVTLVGVNSVDAPITVRQRAWALLAEEINVAVLDEMTSVVGLADTPAHALSILQGLVRGRIVVDVNN